MEYLHKAQQWAGDQTTLEWYLFGGSVVVFQVLYLACGIINSQGAKSKSCWISHVHCFFTVPSACFYWLTQPVDFWSSQWMLEGPGGDLNDWMRCTVAFSVGYFVNDMVLILMDPEVGGMDMLVHHILCIGFWGGGLLDKCGTAYHFLFMIEELPTPFLNLRFQFRDSKDGIIYKVSQAGFVILFFLSRIVIGTGIMACNATTMPAYYALQSSWTKAHIVGQSVAWILSRVLNFFWFSKIVKIVLRGGHKQHFDEDKLD
mmetsp:Transcript_62554/g.101185  ORF Transcript_62554/g.101185 Transcript_62554/m.101185 type:complete len:259 (-) Transcript_62554:159-935(-)